MIGKSRRMLSAILSAGMFIFIVYLAFSIAKDDKGGSITGFAVIEQGSPPVLSQVPPQNLTVYEEFVYRLEVDDQDSVQFTFQDNTRLFNVDEEGVIRFTPSTDDIGRHTAVVVVEDESGNFDSILISFNIT